MNYFLNTANGGIPFVWDDWRWQHDSEIDALQKAIVGLANGTEVVRLEGVEITGAGNPQNVSEGYVLVQGEIVKVDAHTTTNLESGIDYRHVVITESFDAAGNKALQDGGTADTYRKRRATVVGAAGTLQPGEIAWNDPPYLRDIVGGMAADWVASTPDAGFSTELDVLTGNFRSKQVGTVCFVQWDLTIDLNADTNILYFDMPIDRAPIGTQTLGCFTVDGTPAGRQLVFVQIDQNKRLTLVTTDAANITDSGGTFTFGGSSSFRITGE